MSQTQVNESRPWWVRFRWKVRTLLLLTVLIAIGLAVERWTTRQRGLYDEVLDLVLTQKVAFKSRHTPALSTLEWLQLNGRDGFRLFKLNHEIFHRVPWSEARFVRAVGLISDRFTEAEVRPVLQANDFVEIDLATNHLTPNVLHDVARSSTLVEFEFNAPDASEFPQAEPLDGRLRSLARCPRLSRLTLKNWVFTAEAGPALAALPSVETLQLDGSRLNAECIDAIAQHPQLWQLSLNGCPDLPSLSPLQQVRRLRTLDLGDTNADDEAAEALGRLPELQLLYAAGTPITERGLVPLLNSRSLTRITVDAEVADAGLIEQVTPSARHGVCTVGTLTPECEKRLKEKLPSFILLRQRGEPSRRRDNLPELNN